MSVAVRTSVTAGPAPAPPPAVTDSELPALPAGLRLAVAALETRLQEIRELASAAAEALRNPTESLSTTSPAFAEIARRTIPRWHFAMLNDAERNEALTGSLAAVIPPGATVLDIGTGSGLLAMSAVRAGAGHVYTCELNPLLAEVAGQIITAQGMDDRITVISRASTGLRVGPGLDLPAPVDVLVSEIVDCGLIGEALLPTIRHAREHLLRPGGLMIPSAGRIVGRLVGSEALVRLNQVTEAAGFDVSLLNVTSTRGHFPVRLDTWPHQLLSEQVELAAFDLTADPLLPGSRPVRVTANATTQAHGLVAWFEMDLAPGMTLSNSPADTSSHWMQAFIPFDKPYTVTEGSPLDLEVCWSDYSLTVN